MKVKKIEDFQKSTMKRKQEVRSNTVTWSMPHTEMQSTAYSVSAEGTPIPAWLARVREAINKPADAGWTSMLG